MFKKIIKKFNNKFRKFFGLHEIDKLMLEFINYDNGFFIEVGANDGINQSNTLHFERFKRWKGILIEPNCLILAFPFFCFSKSFFFLSLAPPP